MIKRKILELSVLFILGSVTIILELFTLLFPSKLLVNRQPMLNSMFTSVLLVIISSFSLTFRKKGSIPEKIFILLFLITLSISPLLPIRIIEIYGIESKPLAALIDTHFAAILFYIWCIRAIFLKISHVWYKVSWLAQFFLLSITNLIFRIKGLNISFSSTQYLIQNDFYKEWITLTVMLFICKIIAIIQVKIELAINSNSSNSN